MNLTNKTTIKDLLKRHKAKPEKYLGQRFILSKKALNKIIAAAEIKKKTTRLLKSGQGLGPSLKNWQSPPPFFKG